MDFVAVTAFGILYTIATLILLALGLAVIFGMMGVINLAQAEFLMVGAYTVLIVTAHGASVWVGIAVAPVVVGLLGLVIERTIIRFLYGRILDTMLATWGLSLGLVGLVTLVFGPTTEGIATPLGHVTVGEYRLSVYSVFVILMAFAVLGLTYGLFNYTRFGLVARATMQNPNMVRARREPRAGVHGNLCVRRCPGRPRRWSDGAPHWRRADARPGLHRQDLHHGDRRRARDPPGHDDGGRGARPRREPRLLRFDAHLRSGRHARLRDHPSPAPPPGHLRLLAPRRLVTAWALWAVAVAVVAALPAVLSPFQIVQLTVFMIYSLLALSLDLIWGFGGILSFGQAAFFGVGGYVYGIVGINSGSTTLALIAGVAGAAGLAALLGYFTFYGRVGSMYFAVITLTVTLILHQVMGTTADPRYAVGQARLGGYNGMTNIPSLALEVPGRAPLTLDPVQLFYVVGGLLLLVLALTRALVRGSFGRVLAAIREDELRTELLGYDPRWRKLVTFAISGSIAGLAGGLFAGWGNFMNPQVFSMFQSALVVIWVMVGGRSTLYGAVVGTLVVQSLTNYLGTASVTYTTVALGTALVVIVLLFPRGLVPAIEGAVRRVSGRRPPAPEFAR